MRRPLVILVACLVGAALCAGALLALAGSEDGDEPEVSTATLPEGEPVAANEVEVGDCFNDLADEGAIDYSDFPVVACREPHDNEVFHLFEVPEPADAAYPGDTRVADVARDGCLDAFEPYVGRPYQRSVLEILAVPPSVGSWSTGDREVLCALYDGSRQPLTGSVEGTDR